MSFYEKTGATAAGSSDHRRKWDADEFEKKAQERLKAAQDAEDIKHGRLRVSEDEPKVKRAMLKARDYKVDLESKVGKAVVINKTTPSAESGGFYCDVCDCVVKDSINFLDHINGKNHQRNMGMSMKVERSTVDDVRRRLELMKEKKEREAREQILESMLDDVHEEETKMHDYKKEKRSEQKKRKREPDEEEGGELDPELQAMMGFGGFGGSKKN